MLAIITKANDNFWYELKEINNIYELYDIYPSVIVQKVENDFKDWEDYEFLDLWDGIKKEDIPLIKKADCIIILYNDCVE